jgi:hypothetical protein
VHRHSRRAGTRMSATGMIAALAAAALIASGAGAPVAVGAPARLTASTAIALTRPDHYIKSWHKRIVDCPSFTHRPWVFWKTYAAATIGDRWALFATSRSLCKPAKQWARKVSDRVPFHAGAVATDLGRSYSAFLQLRFGPHKLSYSPGSGIRCWELPTSWEGSAELDLQSEKGPGANDAADAQAVGITASWVVCLSGGRLVNDQFVGLSFFVYGPLATSCELVYNIKADQPDPQNPGQMVPPPYADAKVWGDYGQSACP